MPPLPSPAFVPPLSTQPQDPYPPHPDASASPSTSIHPNRAPPHQPTYPTLSYPQQNGWMYPPNYYPPQPRYNPGPYYPPAYGQMGGPGPGTMQNGYGGYQPDGFPPHLRQSNYGQHQQPYPPTSVPHPASDGDQSNASQPMDNASFPQRPQPPMQHGYNPSYPPVPNGHVSPPGPQPPYQTFYPPDHPYAHGGGFGYPQYPPGPNIGYGNGYAGYQDGPPPMSMMQPQQPMGKSLNPTARGFSFAPSQARPRNHNPDPPPPPLQADNVPSFASIQPVPNTTLIPNGHTEPAQQARSSPVVVEGEKLDGTGDLPTSGDSVIGSNAGDTLGLTQMEASDPPATAIPSPTPPRVASVMTQSTSTPAMSTSPTTPTSPISVQTPKVTTDGETSLLVSPKLASKSHSQVDGQWNFVGPSMSGYISPPPSATVPSFSQAMATRSASSSAPPRRRPVMSAESGPLRLRLSRPEADSTSENAYNSSMSAAIPKTVRTENVEVSEEAPRLTAKGKGKASGKKVVFAAGVNDDDMARIGAERKTGKGLVFGSVADDARRSSSSTSIPPPDVQAPAATTDAAPPKPPPPPKPSSWAALFGGASKPTSRSSSGPSSVLVSPSKSIISLATESEAGPSRLPTEPTTPRSTAPTLPPSTGASAASAPRPVFNYAAAAAAGANLTPQEELAKLLTDGLRGRLRDAPVCLPRGLVNTGNMCFANTILQVLVYCPPFTNLLEELSRRLPADLARRTPLLEAMILFLREFTPLPSSRSLSSSSAVPNGSTTPTGKGADPMKEAFIPENVYDAVKDNKRFDSMRRGYQEDAEEYLGFFLNTLHEEMLYVLSRTSPSRANGTAKPNGDVDRQIERPVSPGADGAGWLEVGKKQRTNAVRSSESRESAVSRLFGGTIRSVLHTPGQKDSVTLEPYQPLQLDIQSAEVSTISDALRHISEPETVPGVWSSARGSNVDATKQVYIETFPPVLILHLKRFVYDGMEQSVVKWSKLVAYGTELVISPEIISPGRRAAGAIKYKLFGVVYHHGTSASGGHYTVAVARQDAAGWVHFDDETYAPVPTDAVVVSSEEAKEGRAGLIGGRERCAYLLFYQRVRA